MNRLFAIWDVFWGDFFWTQNRTLPFNIHLTISRSWSLVKVDGNLTTCLWLPVVLKGKIRELGIIGLID